MNKNSTAIEEIINHPLKNTLGYLPQCLAIAGIAHGIEVVRKLKNSSHAALERQHEALRRMASGTYTSWSYAGNWMTMFCLHQEDCMLPSSNLMLAGSPKIWICLTEDNLRRLVNILKGMVGALNWKHDIY